VTLSSKYELIIDLLRDGEMYGLDMVKKSGGKLRRGAVYLTLTAMEAEGLIEGTTIPATPPRMPRRLYRVTEDGLQTFLRRHASPLPTATAISV
jgi:DNA-binding PadR family transcriptional regulator